MKLGACTYPYLYKCSIEESFRSMCKMGFKCIEVMSTSPHIWLRDISPERVKSLRMIAEENNAMVTSINPTYLDMNLSSMNPGFRNESILQMKETINFAAEIGAPIVIFILGRRHPLLPAPYSEVWKLARDAVEQCIKNAEAKNVIIGLENSGSSFMHTAGQLVRFADDIDHDKIKIVYDVANGYMNEDPLKGLEIVKDYLVHVHLSDTDEIWRHWPLGRGVLNFEAISKKLKELNYKGVSIVEFTESEEPESDYIAATKELISYGWSL